MRREMLLICGAGDTNFDSNFHADSVELEMNQYFCVIRIIRINNK